MDLLQLRKNIQYNQEQMASLLDVSVPTYRELEKGKRTLTRGQEAILSSVGVSPEEVKAIREAADKVIGVPREITLKAFAAKTGICYQTAYRKAAEQRITGKQLIPGLKQKTNGRYYVDMAEYERAKVQERI